MELSKLIFRCVVDRAAARLDLADIALAVLSADLKLLFRSQCNALGDQVLNVLRVRIEGVCIELDQIARLLMVQIQAIAQDLLKCNGGNAVQRCSGRYKARHTQR